MYWYQFLILIFERPFPTTLKSKEQIPFWLLTIGAIIVLVFSRLVKDGMFTDGVLYAAIAHNLAIGKGTFWHPYFDNYLFTFFHQQPPLTFGLQALFYKTFGDSIYVERGYSFLTVCISALLITKIWKLINNDNEEWKSMSWLPVFFWIIMPACFFAYSNNLEENTMGVFILIAVLFIYKGLLKQRLGWVVLGSAFTVIASLCKGFPGLFPIVIPIFYFIVVKPKYNPINVIVFSGMAIIVPFIIYALLLANDTIYNSLTAYLNDRVINSIQQVSNVDTRFYLLIQLFFVQLMPPVIITAILLFAKGLKTVKAQFDDTTYKRNIKLFVLIGVSASFPLIVTKEQRVFYLVPSLPYYAIALSLIAVPALSIFIKKIDLKSNLYKLWVGLTSAFVVISLVVSCIGFGQAGRDKDKLHDVYAFGKMIPAGSDVNVSKDTWQDWSLHNYFVRSFNISLDMDSAKHEYYILDRSNNESQPAIFKTLVAKGEKYELYKR